MEPMGAEEMTATNRKREREDKIGRLMGEYLLKGYKMLSSTCNNCGTILLRDRKQQDYCIGCHEVDEQLVAPVLCQKTSIEVMQQTEMKTANTQISSNTDQVSNRSQEGKVVYKTPNVQQAHPSESCEPHFEQCIGSSTLKLQERISWATSQLGSGNSVEMDIKLSELIYNCGKALKTLRKLQK